MGILGFAIPFTAVVQNPEAADHILKAKQVVPAKILIDDDTPDAYVSARQVPELKLELKPDQAKPMMMKRERCDSAVQRPSHKVVDDESSHEEVNEDENP